MFKWSLIFWFTGLSLFGQTESNLMFDVHYGDAVQEWVAFPSLKKQGQFVAGYIYVSPQEGIVFHYHSSFHLGTSAEIVPDGIDTQELNRIRLGRAYNFKMARLGEEHRQKLQLPLQPQGFAYHYVADEIQRYYLTGKALNADREFERAQVVLEKVYEKNPHYSGVELELAYSYNGIRRYDLTITLLTKALENDASQPLFYKELAFAFLNSGMVTMAEKTYQQCLEKTQDKGLKSEIGSSMAYYFYLQKKEEKFKEWRQVVDQNADAGSQYQLFMQQLERNWNNRPSHEMKKL